MYATGTLRVRYRYATPLEYLPVIGEVFTPHMGVILSWSFVDHFRFFSLFFWF